MLNSFPVALMVGTILGYLSGLGVGGGSLLILWLTLVLGKSAQEARVLNLMFFLPAAIVACLFRRIQGNLKPGRILPAVAAGCAAAFLCSRAGENLNADTLKKFFGILLIATGIRELTWRAKDKQA